MNRGHFQQLADVRIDEAVVLVAQGKYDGAYYLAGYAVECGLKACIAKLTPKYGGSAAVFRWPLPVVDICSVAVARRRAWG